MLLLKQRQTIAKDSPPVRLLSPIGAPGAYVASFGWTAQGGAAPTLDTMWTADSQLLAPGRPVREAHSVSLGGLSLDRRVTAHTVAVGGLDLRNVDVQIYRPAPNAPAPSGLLGTGLFSRYRMALDLSAGQLHLVPPSLMIIR